MHSFAKASIRLLLPAHEVVLRPSLLSRLSCSAPFVFGPMTLRPYAFFFPLTRFKCKSVVTDQQLMSVRLTLCTHSLFLSLSLCVSVSPTSLSPTSLSLSPAMHLFHRIPTLYVLAFVRRGTARPKIFNSLTIVSRTLKSAGSSMLVLLCFCPSHSTSQYAP